MIIIEQSSGLDENNTQSIDIIYCYFYFYLINKRKYKHSH